MTTYIDANGKRFSLPDRWDSSDWFKAAKTYTPPFTRVDEAAEIVPIDDDLDGTQAAYEFRQEQFQRAADNEYARMGYNRGGNGGGV